jgi:hypothetical protein
MTDISTLDVEGCSAAEPLETEEDWEDLVGSQLRYWWSEHKYHDRNGWYAELAGSEQCLALGHEWNPDGDDIDHERFEHQPSWDDRWICPDTRYGSCCTECEGECYLGDWPADDILWAAVREHQGVQR